MEPIVPHKKLEPGVFQGRPDIPESEKVVPPRLIRTMKSDVAEAIKNQNETTVSIAIAEEKKKAVSRAESSTLKTQSGPSAPAPRPFGRIIIVIIVLLIITGFGLAYVFVLPKFSAIKLPSITIPSFGAPKDITTATTTEVVVAPTLAPSLIPAQSEKLFNITTKTREQIFAEIMSEMKQGLSAGSIKNLYFEESVATEPTAISANRLFVFADISAPEILGRSLEKPFMVGFWGEENWGATPFVVLKVSGYDTGFAGMLEWEKNLPRAFDAMFGTKVDSGVASKNKFQDIVVLERDARAIETPLGGGIAYAFANDDTIVIAGSQTALEALIAVAGKN